MQHVQNADLIRETLRSRKAEVEALEAQLAALEARELITKSGQEASEEESVVQAKPHAVPNAAQRPLSQEEYRRYGRQLILPEIGLEGQLRLRKARVLIVGVGGLGCPAAAYLAGAGVGMIGLIDGDTVDTTNLHRQILHSTARVGMSKVESAVAQLEELNPLVTYKQHVKHLTPEEAVGIFQQYDLVLDCTDHPTSRYLISDACIITGRPLVSASALKTDGQLIVLNNPPLSPGEAQGGPCYRCIFPKPPPADSVVSCGEGGILGPVVGTMGVLQALEAIKILAAALSPETAQAPKPRLLMFSAYSDIPFRTVKMRGRRAACAVCSNEATITASTLSSGSLDYVAFCGTRSTVSVDSSHRISPSAFAHRLGKDSISIDVRDDTQYNICKLTPTINIPWTGDSQSWLKEFAASPAAHEDRRDIMLICRLGNDSQLAVNAILDSQHGSSRKIYDVVGGFRAYRKEVDKDWPDY